VARPVGDMSNKRLRRARRASEHIVDETADVADDIDVGAFLAAADGAGCPQPALSREAAVPREWSSTCNQSRTCRPSP
jgi:hypothetical protein